MTTIPDTADTVVKASHVPGALQGRWTIAALEQLPDDGNRYELIDGVLYMSPSPIPEHQNIADWVTTYLKLHLQRPGLGRVFSALDVELPGQSNLLRPDVIAVLTANTAIIQPKRIVGVPDLLVEVASPGTAAFDRDVDAGKQGAYQRAGVPEYWIIDPAPRTVEILTLDAGCYRSLGIFTGQDTLPSRVLPAFPVAVAAFFM
jgi:Uma2 family endonuclease